MPSFSRGALTHRIGVGAAVGAAFLVLVGIGSGSARLWLAPSTGVAPPSFGVGIVGGAFVTGAACAAVVTWRRNAGRMRGWIVTAGALVAAQSLLVSVVALVTGSWSGWAITAMLVVAGGGLVLVTGLLLEVGSVDHVIDDGFAIGLGMGVVAAGYLLVEMPLAQPPASVAVPVLGLALVTHIVAVVLVLRERVLPARLSWFLGATPLAVGAGVVLHASTLSATPWDSAGAVVRAAVGAGWIGVGWVGLRRLLEEDRLRINTFQHLITATTREERERSHELRSTLAGLITGSTMLEHGDLPAETRDRFRASVRRELQRMERLLAHQDRPATDIDLDDALDLILDLQRLKGRQVECRSSGDVGTVRARFDALAEVLNILMDNAVTHGGTDSSVVEVVRRDEETIDIAVTDFGRGIPQDQRAQIFEWGQRRSDSPGEGIGLHLAQRLVSEDGGSLRLAEDQGVGSSFVISLPAPRTSPENDLTTDGQHAWQRSG